MGGPSGDVNNCDKKVILKKNKKNGSDSTDFAPTKFHVINLDILVLIISICSHIFDIGFDIHLAYRYYRHGQMNYFYLTALFILFPALVNTVISLRMYVMDEQCVSVSKMMTRKWVIRIIVLLFQLAPILRYCDCLDYALKARRAEKNNDKVNQKKYYEMMLKEDSDVALLRVFECFLEAAPQAILQTTILLIDSKSETLLQVFHQAASIASSLLSMAWSMASYHRSIRFVQEDKDNMSYAGTAMQFLWHFNVTVSRILAVSIAASLYPAWTSLACAVHWAIMTSWLMLLDRVAFCVAPDGVRQQFGEVLFCAILGLVYIFTYLTPGEGRTRHRYLAYYPLCFIENVFMALVWYHFAPPIVNEMWYFYPLFGLSIFPFVVGIAFMLAYYSCFHPKKKNQRRNEPAGSAKAEPAAKPHETPEVFQEIVARDDAFQGDVRDENNSLA